MMYKFERNFHNDWTDDRLVEKITVECDHIDIQEVINTFKSFLIASGFSQDLVEEYIPEEYICEYCKDKSDEDN